MQPTSIFVGGLSEDIQKKNLESEFNKFGTINKIWVARNPPGFAFIEFSDDQGANKAINEMNGAMINGSKIRVNPSRSNGRRGDEDSKKGGGSSGGFRGPNKYGNGRGGCSYENEGSNFGSGYHSRSSTGRAMEEAMNDPRFSHIRTDKRFQKVPKHIKKVTVNKKFNTMFKDKEFTESSQLDKRGRKLDLRPAENLKNLYEVTSESSDSDEVDDSAEINEREGETRLSDQDTDKVDDSTEIKESKDETSSSDQDTDKDSSEESDDEDDDDDDHSSGKQKEDFDHKWEELRNEAPDTDEITHRIAICNMDWDRIRADDLFVCFNSFKPADGCIKSIKIYPSDYGLKRMEEEKVNGPPELVEEKLPLDAEESEEDTKKGRYHREKLRQYQINRLKYYYAVVDCDSSETANVLHEQLNGMEYESSSVRFDLRFIPDDVTFDHEPVSVADKVPDPTKYEPRLFVTSALQQVKVNLTWDETDPKRREILKKAFTDPKSIENDLHDYLASPSSSSESEDGEMTEEKSGTKSSRKERIDKFRNLLRSIEEEEESERKEKESRYEMEITWEPGLKEKTKKIVKEKMEKESLNPFEEMLQKKKEDRKLKKKEQKASQKKSDDESEDDSSEGSFSKNISVSNETNAKSKRLAELALISDSKKELNVDKKFNKKNKKSQEIDFKVNVSDPRFSSIYSSPLFNIDPSDPQYKDTEGNRAFIQEKQRKLQSTDFHDRKKNSKRAKYS